MANSNSTLGRLIKFIVERERIRLRRRAGIAKPWTTDPILQQYRFCNVHRNDDKVTKWIHEWAYQWQNEPDLWFGLAVARFVNWPDSLQQIGWPVPWSARRFVSALNKRSAQGHKVFTGAYMIRASAGDPGTGKPEYLAQRVLGPAWKKRDWVRPTKDDTLASFAARLQELHDFGSFMTGQVVADAKCLDVRLMDAPDWATWAISGPGSRRGLNRVLNNNIDKPWKEQDWLWWLQNLSRHVNKGLLKFDISLDNQDLQNCLCEFDKYERVRLGQGRPRSSYPGV
jgi:hypothetical protein